MAVLSREEFNKQYEAARQQGMGRKDAINYLAQAAVAAQPQQSKQTKQTKQKAWQPGQKVLTRDEWNAQNGGTWQPDSWQEDDDWSTMEKFETQQPQYDANAALKNLQNIAATTTDKQLEKFINKYTNKTDAKDTFWGQSKANFDVGKLSQQVMKSWNDWLDDQTDEKLATARAYQQLAELYQANNATALDDENVKLGALSKDIAGYLPQLFNQAKATALPAAVLMPAGAIAGELTTPIPVADAAGGAVLGYKTARTIGSGLYGYQVTRGAAAQTLLNGNYGLSNEQITDMATEEAIISSIIESGDTAWDQFARLPGVGKALNKLAGTGAGKALSKVVQSTALKTVTEWLDNPIIKWARGAIGEGNEEFLQEALSIANERRAADKTKQDSGITGLLAETINVLAEMAQGTNDEGLKQAVEAWQGGATIGAIFDPVQQVVNDKVVAPIENKLLTGIQDASDARKADAHAREVLDKYMSDFNNLDEAKAKEQRDAFDDVSNKFGDARRGAVLVDANGKKVGTVLSHASGGYVIDINGTEVPVFASSSNIYGAIDKNSEVYKTLAAGGKFVSDDVYRDTQLAEREQFGDEIPEDERQEASDILGFGEQESPEEVNARQEAAFQADRQREEDQEMARRQMADALKDNPQEISRERKAVEKELRDAQYQLDQLVKAGLDAYEGDTNAYQMDYQELQARINDLEAELRTIDQKAPKQTEAPAEKAAPVVEEKQKEQPAPEKAQPQEQPAPAQSNLIGSEEAFIAFPRQRKLDTTIDGNNVTIKKQGSKGNYSYAIAVGKTTIAQGKTVSEAKQNAQAYFASQKQASEMPSESPQSSPKSQGTSNRNKASKPNREQSRELVGAESEKKKEQPKRPVIIERTESENEARERRYKEKSIDKSGLEEALNEVGIGEEAPNAAGPDQYYTKPLTKEQIAKLDGEGIVRRLKRIAKDLGISGDKYSLINNLNAAITRSKDYQGKDYSKETSFEEAVANKEKRASVEQQVDEEAKRIEDNKTLVSALLGISQKWVDDYADEGDLTLWQACRYQDISSVKDADINKANLLFDKLRPMLKELGFKQPKKAKLSAVIEACQNWQDKFDDDSYLADYRERLLAEQQKKEGKEVTANKDEFIPNISQDRIEEVFNLMDAAKDIEYISELEGDDTTQTLFDALTGGSNFFETESDSERVAGIERVGDYEGDLQKSKGWKLLPRKVQNVILHALDAASADKSSGAAALGGTSTLSNREETEVVGKGSEQEATRDTLRGLLDGTIDLLTGKPIPKQSSTPNSKALATFYGDVNKTNEAERTLQSEALAPVENNEQFTIDDLPDDVQKIMRRVLGANEDTIKKLERRTEYYQLSDEARQLLPSVVNSLDYWIGEEDGKPQYDWQAMSRFMNGANEWALGQSEFGDYNAIHSAFELRKQVLEFLFPGREFRFDSNSRTLREVYNKKTSKSQYNSSDYSWFERNLGSILRKWKDAFVAGNRTVTLMPESRAKKKAQESGKELNARGLKVKGLDEKYYYNVEYTIENDVRNYFRTIVESGATEKAKRLIQKHKDNLARLEQYADDIIKQVNQVNHGGQAEVAHTKSDAAPDYDVDAYRKAIDANKELIEKYQQMIGNLEARFPDTIIDRDGYVVRNQQHEDVDALITKYQDQIDEANKRIEDFENGVEQAEERKYWQEQSRNRRIQDGDIILASASSEQDFAETFKQIQSEIEEERKIIAAFENKETKISDIWSNKFDAEDKKIIAGLDRLGNSAVKTIAEAPTAEGLTQILSDLAVMDKKDRWTGETIKEGNREERIIQPPTSNKGAQARSRQLEGNEQRLLGDGTAQPVGGTDEVSGQLQQGTPVAGGGESGGTGERTGSRGAVGRGQRAAEGNVVHAGDSNAEGRQPDVSTSERSGETEKGWETRKLKRYKNAEEAHAAHEEIRAIGKKYEADINTAIQSAADKKTKLGKRKAVKTTLEQSGYTVETHESANGQENIVYRKTISVEEAAKSDSRFKRLTKRIERYGAQVSIVESLAVYDDQYTPTSVRGLFTVDNGQFIIQATDYDSLVHELNHAMCYMAKEVLFPRVGDNGKMISQAEQTKRFEKFLGEEIRKAFVDAEEEELLNETIKGSKQKLPAEEFFVEALASGLSTRYSSWKNFDQIGLLMNNSKVFQNLAKTIEGASDGRLNSWFLNREANSESHKMANSSEDYEDIEAGMGASNNGEALERDDYAAVIGALDSIYRSQDKVGLGDIIHTETWTDDEGKTHTKEYSAKGYKPNEGQANTDKQRRQTFYDDMNAPSDVMADLAASLDKARPHSNFKTAKDLYDMEKDHRPFERIQKAAKKMSSPRNLSVYSNSEHFDMEFGTGWQARQAKHGYTDMIKEFQDVCSGVSTFNKLYQKALLWSGQKGVGSYFSEDVLNHLKATAVAEARAYASGNDKSNDVINFRYAAANMAEMLSRRIEKVNDIQVGRQRELIKNAQENGNGGKAKGFLGKVFDQYNRLQISPYNAFKQIDGYNKSADGAGYATAAEIEKANANRVMIEADLKSKLRAVRDAKGYKELANGTAKGTVEVNGRQASLIEEAYFVGLINTLEATTKGRPNWSRLDGINGFYWTDGKTNKSGELGGEWIDLSTDKEERQAMLKDMYEKAKKDLEGNEAAKLYSEAAADMFEAGKEYNTKAYTERYGFSPEMYEKGKYMPTAYKSKNGELNGEWNMMGDLGRGLVPGFMSRRTREAGGYLVVRPLSQVMDNYINQTANFAAYSELADMLNIITDKNSVYESFSKTMADNFGEPMGKWLDNYTKDVNMVREEDPTGVNKFLSDFRNRMMQGALVGSLSVPIKQVSSTFSAMGVVDPWAVVKAFRPVLRSNPNKVGATRNLLFAGRQANTEEAQLLKTGLLDRLRNKGKGFEIVLDATTHMDTRAVANVYLACCYDVEKNSTLGKDIYKNGKNYKDGLTNAGELLVDSLFSEAVLQTQPMFVRQARAEMARSRNEIVRMFSTFRTQQTQNYNRLLTTLNESKAAKKSGDKLVRQAADKELRQTIEGQAIAAASIAALTILSDLVLHKHKKYKDDDDDWDYGKVSERWALNAIEAAAGTPWLGSELSKWLIDAAKGNTGEYASNKEFYGISMGAVSSLKSAMNAVSWLYSDMLKGGKHFASNARYVVNYVSTLMGIPTQNAYNIVNGLYQYFGDVAGKDFLSGYTNGKYEDFMKEWDGIRTDYGNKLYSAIKSGNEAKAQKSVEQMGNNFVSMIKSASLEQLREGTATDEEVINTLMTYADMFEPKAEEAVKLMHMQIDTGYTSLAGDGKNSVKTAWSNGDISDQQAINLYTKYGGKTRDAAKETVEGWKKDAASEKKYGYKYEQLDEAYKDNRIKRNDYKSALVNLGGMDADKAERKISIQEFSYKYPGHDYQDINQMFLNGELSRSEAIKWHKATNDTTDEATDNWIERLDFQKLTGYKANWRSTSDLYDTYSSKEKIGLMSFYDKYKKKFKSAKDFGRIFNNLNNVDRTDWPTYHNKNGYDATANQSRVITQMNSLIKSGDLSYSMAKTIWEKVYGWSTYPTGAWAHVKG